MSLFDAHAPNTSPPGAGERLHASGAGDTVIATLGLALAAGRSRPHAMHLANAAAGIVVAEAGHRRGGRGTTCFAA